MKIKTFVWVFLIGSSMAPSIIAEGGDGSFIDTLFSWNNALESVDPERNKDARTLIEKLIKDQAPQATAVAFTSFDWMSVGSNQGVTVTFRLPQGDIIGNCWLYYRTMHDIPSVNATCEMRNFETVKGDKIPAGQAMTLLGATGNIEVGIEYKERELVVTQRRKIKPLSSEELDLRDSRMQNDSPDKALSDEPSSATQITELDASAQAGK